mmetsp:Transcript_29505/g.57913  ORF Transcript_29505/g.57913 Transcript_29505/m.57913 type:complete len:214 (-) Transcript_29505:2068-2709(-)
MGEKKDVWEFTPSNIENAANIIRDGGLVVCPSDTNLAITIDPWNEKAVQRVFEVKRRPATSPLTLFIGDPGDWKKYGEHDDPDMVDAIVNEFWPGPLNIVLKASKDAPRPALMGGDTISIGCLGNPIPQALIASFGLPVAMTSANLSGQANNVLVDVELAHTQIGADVDAILNGGAMDTTASSTIISLVDEFKVLRQGDIVIKDTSKASHADS